MNTAIQIITPNSEDKIKVENIRKTSHEEYDKNGLLQTNHYVEYTVIGKNRNWVNFMPLKEFKKLNPKVKL